MEQKIKSITEAYSQQPCFFVVVNLNKGKYLDCDIVEIKEEIKPGIEGNVYVGYNKKKQKLFQYLANACNVQYFI